MEENYKAGLLDGVRREWHEIGKIRLKEYYKDGELDGARKAWYENGKLLEKHQFKKDLFPKRPWIKMMVR